MATVEEVEERLTKAIDAATASGIVLIHGTFTWFEGKAYDEKLVACCAITTTMLTEAGRVSVWRAAEVLGISTINAQNFIHGWDGRFYPNERTTKPFVDLGVRLAEKYKPMHYTTWVQTHNAGP